MDDDRPEIVLVAVEGTDSGELEVETIDGETIRERVLTLDLECMVGETGSAMPVTLVIPVSCGPQLLRALLTEEQFEAVLSADG